MGAANPLSVDYLLCTRRLRRLRIYRERHTRTRKPDDKSGSQNDREGLEIPF